MSFIYHGVPDPLLDCLWNDVLQFLPLHPQKVFDLQVKLGIIPEVPAYKYYEIDIAALDPTKTVIYFKSAPGEENITVKWLSEVDLATIQEIPEVTINYYKTLIGSGELPFNYQFIPRILFKATINVCDVHAITL